ncbi:hypothetical protein SCHPADRAFT_881683 [Schizopora paradoxa]|uniref:DUF1793-domain-containing protein n=1 Tax=Schizopora paradoxa TaxID=27342 RepID=A0A0H2R6P7_9AGAM|nr:hypothetical protein SCHPADRAFT_881683 [Schizopora paradoxa]
MTPSMLTQHRLLNIYTAEAMVISTKDLLGLVFILFGFPQLCYAEENNETSTPFSPTSWPLAVKGPYLNSWLSGGAKELPLSWSSPAFWPAWDDQTTWSCIVTVDSAPYMIMGSFNLTNTTHANQTAISFTATRTSATFAAGPVIVNATFLSPVTPNDLVRQSMPFVYFYLDISSTDGASHNIRIYSDINPQWLHGNEVKLPDPSPKVNASASLINSSDFVGLQILLVDPQPFSEVANHAQDVTGVFAMKSSSNVTYQVGEESSVRALGTNGTELENTIDASYSDHALDNPFDAFAFAVDLGAIQNTSEPIVWTIGMLRDPSINLTTASGTTQLRSSYYWSNFSTIPDIISFVLDDFDTARSTADAFDQMINDISLSNVTGYTDLLSLATRQIFGALEITIPKASNGTWNRSDIMIFSKDLGDVSSAGITNVVDVMYAGFPAILYLNPGLGKHLLYPILASQVDNGKLIGQAYAPMNLGSEFPNASSSTSPHNMGIEESGNMLIMVLAHFQKTGDLSMIQDYYPLLKSWANYLVTQTLFAGYQTTSLSDGITSFNQTNVVLKGIIGISAMSLISSAMDQGDDQTEYQMTAQRYMQVWLDGALSQDHSHLLSSFGDQDSNGLVYNVYADKLLGLGLIPSTVKTRTCFKTEHCIYEVKTPFGVPLNGEDSSLSRLDWTMFTIASFLSEAIDDAPATLQSSLSMLTNYATSNFNSSPLAVVYNPENGMQYSGSNRFVRHECIHL